MSAALKPVPRQPQRAQASLQPPRRSPLNLLPQEPPSTPGKITRLPSRADLVSRQQGAAAPLRTHQGHRTTKPEPRRHRQLSPTAASKTSVRSLPTAPATPNWLKLLLVLQQVSGPMTLTLVAAALVVYGWTVHVQQIWSNNFHQLERLQQQERNLTAYSQMMNHEIAKQAEAPNTNLVMPGPENTLFLEPPPPLPAIQSQPSPIASPHPIELKAPMGY